MSNNQNFTRYMNDVRGFPLLDRETELDLARRWRDCRDPEAARQLVGSHQRLVVKIAGEYRKHGLPLSDLISEGNIGLMKALEKFDLDRGFRFSTYAMWWIRAAISDHMIKSSSLVKTVTNEHRKKLFFNLRRLKAKVQPLDEGALSPSGVTAIAQELGVPESEIVIMDRYLGTPDVSLSTPVGDGSSLTRQDLLIDDSQDQEADLIEADERDKRRTLLADALGGLTDRERHILTERRLQDDPPRLAELGEYYGISRERVRQIEAHAFEKLKDIIGNAAYARGMLEHSPA